MIPYGRQYIDEEDIKAVAQVLRSDFLTTGPKVQEFEQALADFCESNYAVSFSSGTAALHACMYALGIGPGDEVIAPAMTFVATANCVAYMGATPVFADVIHSNLLIDPQDIIKKITPNTKAIIAVDYAGLPCNWDALRQIADDHGLFLVADSCHALGASHKGKMVGSIADLTVFSFHPLKHITTGEGGAVTTHNPYSYQQLKTFRNHGITTTHQERKLWHYEMVDLGYNYRLSDIQCALGISQLKKMPWFLKARQEIADTYMMSFIGWDGIQLLGLVGPDAVHAYHLFVIKVKADDRERIFKELRARGIGVQVHYIPVHLHPYYRQNFGTGEGLCPVAEQAYQEIISLPIYPGMGISDVYTVINTVKAVV